MIQTVGGAPFEEDAWIGRDVQVGGAVVRVVEECIRCAVTTVDPDTGERDVDALRAMIEALKMFPNERRAALYSSSGDRRDGDIVTMGELLGNAFDRVILYEDPTDMYERKPGEIVALLRQGLAAANRVKVIEAIEGGLNAFKHALRTVQPGELLLAQAHLANPTMTFLREYLEAHGGEQEG